MENNYFPFVNLPLEYEKDALEPFIDEKTMELHHDRHLQTYIDNLNKIIAVNPALENISLPRLIKMSGRLPKKLGNELRNNAGGVYNHRFFFDIMTPIKKIPDEQLLNDINKRFCSFENFKSEFKDAALSVFGSGYAWLVYDRGILKIITTKNQNSPIEQSLCPILGIDVWEHAYYLKHYNKRADYIDDWFNVIDWDKVLNNLNECKYIKF